MPYLTLDDKAAGTWDRKERRMRSARPKPPATTPRRRDTSAARVRRLVDEACNNGNLAVLDAVLAPVTGTADAPAGARLPELLAAFRAAVPDARWTITQ